MLLFAVTAVEKIQTLPPSVWAKIGIGILAVIVAVVVLRKLAGTNKLIVGVVAFVVMSVVFFSWVYNRNEPQFLTPVIDRIAPFLPSAKGAPAKAKQAPKP